MVSGLDRRIKKEIKFTEVKTPGKYKSVVLFDKNEDADNLYYKLANCSDLKGRLCFSSWHQVATSEKIYPPRVIICSLIDAEDRENPWKFAKERLFQKEVRFADDEKVAKAAIDIQPKKKYKFGSFDPKELAKKETFTV